MSSLISDAISICLLSYVIGFSLAKRFAKDNGYEIKPNQELFALGLANTFSSFFQCFPCCASVSRSTVQERVGGRTQLASLISALLMFLMLNYASEYLSTLPKVNIILIIKFNINFTHKIVSFSLYYYCCNHWTIETNIGIDYFLATIQIGWNTLGCYIFIGCLCQRH